MSSKKTPNHKRKHNASESSDDSVDISKQSTPQASPRKIVKKESDSSDSDDDGVQIKLKTLIPPHEMLKHLEKMKEVHDQKREPTMKHAIATYTCDTKGVDTKEVQSSLTKYLGLSVKPSQLNLKTGATMMMDFLTSHQALKFIPGFPHPPKNSLFCYAALNNLENGLGMLKEASDKMKKDDKGREKAEKEAEKRRAEYISSLESFLHEKREILSETQQKHLQATIMRHDKALHPEKYVREKKEKAPGSGKKRGKKESKTPFEHFVSLSEKLYTEYSPEKRMKKLQKKFDKLEPTVREVYDNLALRG